MSVTPSGNAAPKDQFFPWLAIDGTNGDAYAVWYDNRNDPTNQLIETFIGVSTDGGETWTNVLVSDEAWNPGDAFFSCGCFIGDYNGMAPVVRPTRYGRTPGTRRAGLRDRPTSSRT